jgi:hypothetical protein
VSDLTDVHVQRMIDALVGREHPHLTGWIADAIGGALLGAEPARAVRVDLEPIRAGARGTRRQFVAAGPVHRFT